MYSSCIDTPTLQRIYVYNPPRANHISPTEHRDKRLSAYFSYHPIELQFVHPGVPLAPHTYLDETA